MKHTKFSLSNISILGHGIVGKATHQSVLDNSDKIQIFDLGNVETFFNYLHDLVFICIPTNNQQDLDQIKDFCYKINTVNPNTLICLRSSVPIGYCNSQLSDLVDNLIYFPEFLRERKWQEDCQAGPLVIGADKNLHDVIANLCPNRETISMSLAEAEVLKMMSNAHSAMQVVFANHMCDISQQHGANYNKIEQSLELIRHRDQNYLQVSPTLKAFGGKCLPKDLKFLIDSFQKCGIAQTLFTSVGHDNQKWPVTVREDQ